jgi:hypothetical protein
MSFMNRDACVSAMLHKRMIKLRPRSNGGKDSTNIGQGKFNCSARWRVHDNIGGDLPIGNARWIKPKLVKDSQCIRGEAIATTLVAGERGFVHHGHVVPETMKGGCTRGS